MIKCQNLTLQGSLLSSPREGTSFDTVGSHFVVWQAEARDILTSLAHTGFKTLTMLNFYICLLECSYIAH